MELETQLAQGLKVMKLALPPGSAERLLNYLTLLRKWNRRINLTAVREPAQMISRHLLDSLSILHYVRGPRVVDIGTGAGLPGIPLAVALPNVHFVLLDSNAKKVRFVRQAVQELQLPNIEVIQERAEKFRPEIKFDTLITRAFAAIPDMLASCGHICAAGGQILAMKGVYPQEELAEIPEGYNLSDVQALQVPGLEAERHVVLIRPVH